jgi:hypothetical protein
MRQLFKARAGRLLARAFLFPQVTRAAKRHLR